MLPGGMMPVTQLVTMIRSSPAKGAASLLMAMPAERLPVVAAALRASDIARLVPVLAPQARKDLVAAVSDEQLTAMVGGRAPVDVTALLPAVPTRRLGTVVAAIPDATVAALLDVLPADECRRVAGVTEPEREHGVLRLRYLGQVAAALGRANLTLEAGSLPLPANCWLVTALRRRIAVAAGFGDDGRVAVRDAEDLAYRVAADGALAVVDLPIADDVLTYCRGSEHSLGVVTWTDDRHDGHLTRTVVTLFQ